MFEADSVLLNVPRDLAGFKEWLVELEKEKAAEQTAGSWDNYLSQPC